MNPKETLNRLEERYDKLIKKRNSQAFQLNDTEEQLEIVIKSISDISHRYAEYLKTL